MPETYVSVDIEAAGPSTEYSMLSLGAVEVGNHKNTFSTPLLQPINDNHVDQAVAVGFPDHTWVQIKLLGEDPYYWIKLFADWLEKLGRPIMVGFPLAFDWQFVNYYLHRFAGRNPFGISGVCIKSLYMGHTGCDYKKTTKRSIPNRYHSGSPHTHNALDDALEQAELFENILKEIRSGHH